MLLCNHKELVFPWSKILKRARFHLLKFLTFEKILERARFHLLKFLTFEKIFHEFDNHDEMSNNCLMFKIKKKCYSLKSIILEQFESTNKWQYKRAIGPTVSSALLKFSLGNWKVSLPIVQWVATKFILFKPFEKWL